MIGKGFKSSQLALAIATVLSVGAVVAPSPSSAKTSAEAIIGTGRGAKANAIIGTGADAIIGTGADAIIGTGAYKSASTNAIIGTGRGAKANAIIGTGADAIIGTGADAIIGTGIEKASSPSAIIGTGKPAVLLLGPVDSVDVSANTIEVLGRTLRMPHAERVATAIASGRQLYVAVTARMSASGKFDSAVLRFLPGDYVAGSSKVILAGRASSIETGTATLMLGKTRVDYSAATLNKPISQDAIIFVVGTQPGRGGIVLAEKVLVR